MKFEIDKPDHELSIGYVTLIIKYIVLFISSYIIVWFFLLFAANKPELDQNGMEKVDRLINNSELVNWIISILIMFFYTLSLYNKSKYGIMKTIDFSYSEDHVRIELVNLINGDLKEKIVPKAKLSISKSIKSNPLQGNQRVFKFAQDGEIFTVLNIELSAWIRNDNLENLIKEFEKYLKN